MPRFDRTAVPDKTDEYMRLALAANDHCNDAFELGVAAVRAYEDADLKACAYKYRRAAEAAYAQADALANIATLFENVQP